MAEISVDNGRTFITAAEALEKFSLREMFKYMDDIIKEQVFMEFTRGTELNFLERYLQLAKENLIIG